MTLKEWLKVGNNSKKASLGSDGTVLLLVDEADLGDLPNDGVKNGSVALIFGSCRKMFFRENLSRWVEWS